VIEIECPCCQGTGRVEKPLDKCTPYELATEAHKQVCNLWQKREIEELANVVAILYELKRKLKNDP